MAYFLISKFIGYASKRLAQSTSFQRLSWRTHETVEQVKSEGTIVIIALSMFFPLAVSIFS